MTTAVIAGGVGAAKFLRGLCAVVPPEQITAVINVGDDFTLHGLAISPDIDTVTYTLAGQINPDTGWGRAEESWRVLEELKRLGGQAWFQLGDLDIALHLYRTQRFSEGATLSEITAEVAVAKQIAVQLLPATNDSLKTHLTPAAPTPSEPAVPSGPAEPAPAKPAPAEPGELTFQDYFVARQHAVPISAVRFAGAQSARPAPGVIAALTNADIVVIAPSNPFVSIAPVLAVPGISELLAQRRDRVVAVSPIVGGAALKGPAARMMTELGHECSAVGVAAIYKELAATLVIDQVDGDLASAVHAVGIKAVVTDTIMSDPKRSKATAAATLAAVDA